MREGDLSIHKRERSLCSVLSAEATLRICLSLSLGLATPDALECVVRRRSQSAFPCSITTRCLPACGPRVLNSATS